MPGFFCGGWCVVFGVVFFVVWVVVFFFLVRGVGGGGGGPGFGCLVSPWPVDGFFEVCDGQAQEVGG